ncbi:hypothetical protein ACFQ0D_34600, partial [Micromonospora zhanjiangensis]
PRPPSSGATSYWHDPSDALSSRLILVPDAYGVPAAGSTVSAPGLRRYDATGRLNWPGLWPDVAGGRVVLDVATGRIRVDVPAAARLRAVDHDLPAVDGTRFRSTVELDDSTPHQFPLFVRPGERYLLQHVCIGPGRLRVGVVGARGPQLRVFSRCDDGLVNTELVADQPNLLVTVTRTGSEPVTVGVQLVGLP